jgi:hypothetical protein
MKLPTCVTWTMRPASVLRATPARGWSRRTPESRDDDIDRRSRELWREITGSFSGTTLDEFTVTMDAAYTDAPTG